MLKIHKITMTIRYYGSKREAR